MLILYFLHIGFDLKKIFTDFEIKINDEIKSAFYFSDNSLNPSPNLSLEKVYA